MGCAHWRSPVTSCTVPHQLHVVETHGGVLHVTTPTPCSRNVRGHATNGRGMLHGTTPTAGVAGHTRNSPGSSSQQRRSQTAPSTQAQAASDGADSGAWGVMGAWSVRTQSHSRPTHTKKKAHSRRMEGWASKGATAAIRGWASKGAAAATRMEGCASKGVAAVTRMGNARGVF